MIRDLQRKVEQITQEISRKETIIMNMETKITEININIEQLENEVKYIFYALFFYIRNLSTHMALKASNFFCKGTGFL